MTTRAIVGCLLLAIAGVAPTQRDEEPPLAAAVVRALRERLAAGSVREARGAVAEMTVAPHSRHGLLLYEAMVRAELRVAAADRDLPGLQAERTQLADDLVAARKSTSTSAIKRIEERIALLDRDTSRLAAQRQVEANLRGVCAEGWQEIAPRLPPAAADDLAEELLARLGEERGPLQRRLLVEMAGAVPSTTVMPALMGFASGRSEPTEIVVVALVALGRRGDPSATPAAIAALAHPDWRVQSEAVEALRRMHRRSSIPFLIGKLAQADGRLKDDLGIALRSLTGERFVADPAIWRDWWEKRQADFAMPAAPAPRLAAQDPAAADGGGTRFFGIGSFSKRVVFVLDVSGSMDEPARTGTDTTSRRSKLEVARAQVKSALAGLASDARFDVLVYATNVDACFRKLEPADDRHRVEAMEFVDVHPTGPGTNIHGALLAALALPDVDTIFFLTDGQPTAGLVRAPELIAREIAGVNRARRVRINTIGVGEHDRAFLEALAEQSGGNYVAR